MNAEVSSSNLPMAHPARSKPLLRSSSVAWPFPCITPSTVTCVIVVSRMFGFPLLLHALVGRSHARRTARPRYDNVVPPRENPDVDMLTQVSGPTCCSSTATDYALGDPASSEGTAMPEIPATMRQLRSLVTRGARAAAVGRDRGHTAAGAAGGVGAGGGGAGQSLRLGAVAGDGRRLSGGRRRIGGRADRDGADRGAGHALPGGEGRRGHDGGQ